MRITVHQPVYLPYLGFFAKIASSDIFVVYDTAQWEKGSIHNRQRIRTHAGSQWLTIPMHSSLTPYNAAPISYANARDPWYEMHWRTIEQHYKRTPHFGDHAAALHTLYQDGHPYNLGDFNMRLIRYFLDVFRIDRRIVFFSELEIDPALSPSEKLAVAVKKLGGTHYISGPSGRKYMELEPFDKRGLTVSYFEFKHPAYEQYHSRFDGQFLPNMGSIDALFNTGGFPDSRPSPTEPHVEIARSHN